MDAPAPRSSSRPRPSSRPTTPLRPSSRSSLREAHGYGHSISHAGYNQPAINALEPQFAELADSMADLEANFMHLQLMHESLTRFSESFASFLYGMNMNAFCVDFPEVCPFAQQRRVGRSANTERLMLITARPRLRTLSREPSRLRLRKVCSAPECDGDRLTNNPYTEAENEPTRPDDGEMTFL